jgi:hypothetical protein
MKTFHVDEPREIGKKKDRLSSKDLMMVKQNMVEKVVTDNTCIHCGNIVNEDLRKWFKQKWVNIGKKDKSGKHPECGTSGEKQAYAKCVPASKARSMSKKQKASATRRKRAAQQKAGRGGRGKQGAGAQGKKPIKVKTKVESVMNINEKNVPTDKSKWSYYKSQAKKKFDVYPSAYANAWAAKQYKAAGGGWKTESVTEDCWVGYKQVGMKKKGNRMVPNCVAEIYWENSLGESCGYTFEFPKEDQPIKEAEYQGRKVKLGKIMQGDAKKFKVYVKNPKGNVVKVNFGQGGDAKGGTMRIRKSNPGARKSFRARHNCDSPGPRHKARYWSCRKW